MSGRIGFIIVGGIVAAAAVALPVRANALQRRMMDQRAGLQAIANGQAIAQFKIRPRLQPPPERRIETSKRVHVPPAPGPTCVQPGQAVSPSCRP